MLRAAVRTLVVFGLVLPACDDAPENRAPGAGPGGKADDVDEGDGQVPSECEAATLPGLLDQIQAHRADFPLLRDGGRFSLSVLDLRSGAIAFGYHDDEAYNPMSSAKLWYLAAALARTGDLAVFEGDPGLADRVTGYFDAAGDFQYGDSNFATYDVVLMAGGACEINDTLDAWGMADTTLGHWCPFASSSQCDAISVCAGRSNRFTTADAVTFLAGVHDGSVFVDPSHGPVFEAWMRNPPDLGFSGPLGTQLPAATRAELMHKVGAAASEYHDIGIVPTPDGAYAIAIATDDFVDGEYWRQQPFVETLSRLVFDIMRGQGQANCEDPTLPWVDATDIEPSAFCAARSGGWWCDGDVVVECSGEGTERSRTECDAGCCTMPDGTPDACSEDLDATQRAAALSCSPG